MLPNAGTACEYVKYIDKGLTLNQHETISRSSHSSLRSRCPATSEYSSLPDCLLIHFQRDPARSFAMVELTIGVVSAFIAAGIAVLQFLLPNALTLVFAGNLSEAHYVVTWSVASRFFLCPSEPDLGNLTLARYLDESYSWLKKERIRSPELPETLVDIYQSGLTDQTSSVSGLFDISLRQWDTATNNWTVNNSSYLMPSSKMLTSLVLDDKYEVH